jgi:hypothetical protein
VFLVLISRDKRRRSCTIRAFSFAVDRIVQPFNVFRLTSCSYTLQRTSSDLTADWFQTSYDLNDESKLEKSRALDLESIASVMKLRGMPIWHPFRLTILFLRFELVSHVTDEQITFIPAFLTVHTFVPTGDGHVVN